jgi:Fe-S cluster assembly protein SufD
MTTVSELDRHVADFRRLAGGAPSSLAALRERGLARFTDSGYPTVALEDWKYTNLAPLARQHCRLADAAESHDAAELAARARLAGALELVVVNGHFAPALSCLAALPRGAVVGSLADALRSHTHLVEPHLGRYAGFDQADESLTALNTAFIRDGVFVHVPAGTVIEAPIHCLFVSLATDGPAVSHPRTLIVAEAGSRLTVVEQYVGDGAYWTNTVTEAVVGAGAALAHYRVQREGERAYHVGVVTAAQAADSTFSSHAVSLGAALARSDVVTRLDAPGAACTFDGLYLVGGTQHVDHHTTIDHREPRGTSRELYKGIMDGRSTGVFNGKVFVRPHAQQSDAQQMNKNLLLSDDAQIETKPQLEIFADDVKCSHGATIGQLDDDSIFYLRARGIDAATARQMLIVAFANELVERVAVAPLRDQLTREIESRLQGAPA